MIWRKSTWWKGSLLTSILFEFINIWSRFFILIILILMTLAARMIIHFFHFYRMMRGMLIYIRLILSYFTIFLFVIVMITLWRIYQFWKIVSNAMNGSYLYWIIMHIFSYLFYSIHRYPRMGLGAQIHHWTGQPR